MQIILFTINCSQLNGYNLSVNNLSVISFLNDLELICLHVNFAVVSTLLYSFNYCYLALIILFNVYHFFADSEVVTSIGF